MVSNKDSCCGRVAGSRGGRTGIDGATSEWLSETSATVSNELVGDRGVVGMFRGRGKVGDARGTRYCCSSACCCLTVEHNDEARRELGGVGNFNGIVGPGFPVGSIPWGARRDAVGVPSTDPQRVLAVVPVIVPIVIESGVEGSEADREPRERVRGKSALRLYVVEPGALTAVAAAVAAGNTTGSEAVTYESVDPIIVVLKFQGSGVS